MLVVNRGVDNKIRIDGKHNEMASNMIFDVPPSCSERGEKRHWRKQTRHGVSTHAEGFRQLSTLLEIELAIEPIVLQWFVGRLLIPRFILQKSSVMIRK